MNGDSIHNRGPALPDPGEVTVRDVGRSRIRPDSALAGLDVAAAITRGVSGDGAARRALFTEAAIAASLHAERLGVGPYPVAFLARFVRTGGTRAASELPEPLIGAEPTALVRHWMAAVLSADAGLDGDVLFARWLEMVAAMMTLRRRTRAGRPPGGPPRNA